MAKVWIVEGKYSSGVGSSWEELEEVTATDRGGPGDSLVGGAYAHWLCREHRTAAPYGLHRVRTRNV